MIMKNSANHSYVRPSVRKLDPASTIAKLEQAAGDGNADAAAMLVRIHANGIGVPRNQQRARGWKLWRQIAVSSFSFLFFALAQPRQHGQIFESRYIAFDLARRSQLAQ